MEDQCTMKNEEDELSDDIKDWSEGQVRQWALKKAGVGAEFADILFQQNIKGANLLLLDHTKLKALGITFGPSDLIITARDELLNSRREQPVVPQNQPGRPCKPYPFQRYHDAYRYKVNSVLAIPESGPTDYIEPCHEFKGYTHTTEETKLLKFNDEVIRFAAACMNSRTNGTIHFGIGDKDEFAHGQVLGVEVKDKEEYEHSLTKAIEDHFEYKHIRAAKMCIKPPRFVEVLNPDMTSSEKYVIEVDIVPDSAICKGNIYHNIYRPDTKKAKKSKCAETNSDATRKQFFVRDGSSSRDLLKPTSSKKPMVEYNSFIEKLTALLQLRQEAEKKHLSVVKRSLQGSRLSEMITGGSQSLDKSNFERYVIVTNKSHPVQWESLGFLLELNPTAVLDFDPESPKTGLQSHFEELITMEVHTPAQYKITEAIEDIASKLKLTTCTSWVLCNGGVREEVPSDLKHWLTDKGASVRNVISFLCRKDVLPNNRYLVLFLLLSTVSENMDPLLEVFNTFRQELRGIEHILCICENESTFTSWKDLIEARFETDISARCIYDLSFSEINGTVLSLLSENRRSERFLPSGGGSNVHLKKKSESSWHTLNILCVNQCEGGNEDKVAIEQEFYRGGPVSWWNLYFSEQPGSTSFIKRDKFDFIKDTAIPDLMSLTNACVSLNVMHIAGCGGTTLCMHILWALRANFRCAVLKDSGCDLSEAAKQVVQLLMYGHGESPPRIPVLLMIDDFEDMDRVLELQQLIDAECVEMNVHSRSPQVILLNCMSAESQEPFASTLQTVFLDNKLSPKEQDLIKKKLEEIEKTHENAKTFYGFMIMKEGFSQEYIKRVAQKTLKDINIVQKHAQLFAVLALLNAYCRGSSLSVSLCEEFLEYRDKAYCGSRRVEDEFGMCSNLITSCFVEAKVKFKAVKIIHSTMAACCLEELAKHGMTKAKILDLLLTNDELYECVQGKGKLMQNVHNMLVKRFFTVKGPGRMFSPLVQDIIKESPGSEENLLCNAAKRFAKDAVMSQLLARYYYLKRKDFKESKLWAEKANKLSRNNSSYIMDTSAQVMKHELLTAIDREESFISEENLRRFLKMAQSATAAFRTTQKLAKQESTQRRQNWRNNCPLNTAGYLGEIQVAVLVIKTLTKTPVFSPSDQPLRHDILSEMLSGKVNIEHLARTDPKHSGYYSILKMFEELLHNLRCNMKRHFDFLDSFYVNLCPRFTLKESRDEQTREEIVRCFQPYVDLFCSTNSKEVLENKSKISRFDVHQAKQFLEMNKTDTYMGILNSLSNGMPCELMEQTVQHYCTILRSSKSVKDKVNFIYANVVLSCMKHSKYCVPFHDLLGVLTNVLRGQIPADVSLALHFIAVALFWPEQITNAQSGECERVRRQVKQMETAFLSEMRDMDNGKRPVVHFYLGKTPGYQRLKHRREIEMCVTERQDIASLWENGSIWKERKIWDLLCRVRGEVQGNIIKLDGNHPDKIEIKPMFRSQLSRQAGSKVSFFIGFSMNGPLAIDIRGIPPAVDNGY